MIEALFGILAGCTGLVCIWISLRNLGDARKIDADGSFVKDARKLNILHFIALIGWPRAGTDGHAAVYGEKS